MFEYNFILIVFYLLLLRINIKTYTSKIIDLDNNI